MQHVVYEMATPDVIAECLDGELLIVNLATGVYFRGAVAAAHAWAALTSGADPDASPELSAFAEQLLTEGLIRVRGAAGSDNVVSNSQGQATPAPAGPLELERFEDLQDMLVMDPIHDVDPVAGWPQAR